MEGSNAFGCRIPISRILMSTARDLENIIGAKIIQTACAISFERGTSRENG